MKNRVGSSGQRDRRSSFGPFWTIVRADLGGLLKSRITYGWLLAAVFIQVVRTLGSSGTGTVSAVVSSGLSDFVFLWALVIIGLSASSVSSESGELADSIMSKSVTRLDYVLAKFASRVSYTLVTFFLVAAVLVGLGLRLEVSDYDVLGLASAIVLVALALATLTALGVGLSVSMPNTVVAIITLLVLWYSMTVLFPAVGFGLISPGSLLETLPDIVKGMWSWGEWETAAGFVVIAAAATALSSAFFHLKDI
jgi:ABC-2 type transport system permease protein